MAKKKDLTVEEVVKILKKLFGSDAYISINYIDSHKKPYERGIWISSYNNKYPDAREWFSGKTFIEALSKIDAYLKEQSDVKNLHTK